MRTRPTVPLGHGEMLTSPPYAEWESVLHGNIALASSWDFEIAGVPISALREDARIEAITAASEFSLRLGVPVKAVPSAVERVIVTGHQPQLYHPGVWVKDFLLQRFADETSSVAIDLVVDTDSFTDVSLRAPSIEPVVSAFSHPLAIGEAGGCYVTAPVPESAEIDELCEKGSAALSSLPANAPARHFEDFCGQLRDAAQNAENLSELVTFARRRFEASAGSDYLELPVSVLCRTESFVQYSIDIMQNANRFASAYNDELGAYRVIHKTRSAAQPFPDLRSYGTSTEIPFWYVDEGSRRTLAVTPLESGLELAAEGERIAVLPPVPAEARDVLSALPGIIAPKAIALTLFARLFLADVFIHGVGGGRYDRIADGVITRYFGQEPPVFTVASMTMYLPLGAPITGDAEVTEAERQLHRFEHNPDEVLKGIECDSLVERETALSLANEKESLVTRIAEPGADKKELGLRIKAVNQELRELLAPIASQLKADLDRLVSERDATEILTDRTYPFCLWDPVEVQDKVL